MKILMVCLGNICRSPLAEGILKAKAEAKGLDWQIESAGTSGFHINEKPDRRSIKIAAANGIDISKQRSRPFVPEDYDEYDIIYAMDSSNYKELLLVTRTEEDRAKLEFIMNEIEPAHNINVPDPYYGEYGFETVFNMLDRACEGVLERHTQK